MKINLVWLKNAESIESLCDHKYEYKGYNLATFTNRFCYTIFKYSHTQSLLYCNLLEIIAESVNSENPTTVYDLEEEDFFERFNLKRVKALGKGMAGEVFLVEPKSGSGRMLAVKKFFLSEDVRERSKRQFSTETGVM